MSATKRATVYFDPILHRALRLKAIQTERSLSELVNAAIRASLAEDEDDLATARAREGAKPPLRRCAQGLEAARQAIAC
jgi:hypothetical protein